eukprot:CAMPEP_0177679868 /NCGR_PEP_ID=MMETSP0447-20121125/29851_1 /TAXON_ID=0 /ORGANISM="Stygamoeba regulata, Strain BSH-02190019" /LENGTH=452 /DNA_ID=CAMNT_0019189125 /DNA_START=427 /DNA_END=1785 /DNA_ORIENTATION=-
MFKKLFGGESDHGWNLPALEPVSLDLKKALKKSGLASADVAVYFDIICLIAPLLKDFAAHEKELHSLSKKFPLNCFPLEKPRTEKYNEWIEMAKKKAKREKKASLDSTLKPKVDPSSCLDQQAIVTGSEQRPRRPRSPFPEGRPEPAVRSLDRKDSILVTAETLLQTTSPADRWDKDRVLGQGSYGSVYHARNKVTGSRIALKQINKVSRRESMMTEIAALYTLQHANIVAYKDAGMFDDKIWISMEYCDAGSVHDLLSVGPLEEKVAAYIATQLVEAMKFLHESGWVHRDIKSENVLLTFSGGVKLADLGLARRVKSGDLGCAGTPMWMAPEVMLNQPYDFKADVFSFGMLVYHMLSGKPVYSKLPDMKKLLHICVFGCPEVDMPPGHTLSMEAEDFLQSCTHLDTAFRFSAKALSVHPYTKKAGKAKTLADYIKQAKTIAQAYDLIMPNG